MLPVITEILAHRTGSVRRNVLHRRGLRGGRSDDDGVVHCPSIAKDFDDLRDRRTLLADSVVNANEVVALVIDDGVDGYGGLASLAVADDQLALSAADRDHAVDGFQPGRHRFSHRLAIDDTRSNTLQSNEFVRGNRTLVVDRLT